MFPSLSGTNWSNFSSFIGSEISKGVDFFSYDLVTKNLTAIYIIYLYHTFAQDNITCNLNVTFRFNNDIIVNDICHFEITSKCKFQSGICISHKKLEK